MKEEFVSMHDFESVLLIGAAVSLGRKGIGNVVEMTDDKLLVRVIPRGKTEAEEIWVDRRGARLI